MKRAFVIATSLMVLAGVASAQGTGTVWLSAADGSGELTVDIGSTAIVQVWMTYEGTGDGVEHTMYGMDAGLRHNKFSQLIADWDNQDGVGFQVVGFNPDGVPGPHGDNPFPLHFGNHGPIDQDGDQMLDEAAFAGNLNKYFLAWGSDGDPASNDSGLDAEEGTLTNWLMDVIVIEGVEETPEDAPDTINFIKKGDAIGPSYIDVFYSVGSWLQEETKFEQGVGKANDRLLVNVVPEPAALALLLIGGLAAIRRR